MIETLDLTILTLGVTVGSALVIILAERLRPYTDGQPLFREGFVNDLVLYTLVQSYVLGWVIFGVINWIDSATSFERMTVVRDLPLGVQVGLALVVHDLYIYWFHRLQHKHALLWRIHEAHHSTSSVDWLSGSRSHALEIVINQTVEFLPIVLFADPEVAPIKGCVDAVWGMYIHSNIDVRSGWLQFVVNGPEMHRWHHARDPEAHDRNFSTKLAVWDWIFGTAYLPTPRKPRAYGIDEAFPSNYMLQQLHAFRRVTHDGQRERS